MTRPILLDLFCGAGGCAVGYHRAGFDVVGVDNRPQPRYPFPFILGDALDVMARMLAGERFLASDGNWYGIDDFAAVHASPPCQAYTVSRTRVAPERRRSHPDLVGRTRALLEKTGVPWVIENVPGAPMRCPFTLCGGMFGLGATGDDGAFRPLRRHRLFESSVMMLAPGCACGSKEKIGVYGNGGGWANRYDPARRGYKGNVRESRDAIGCDWMTIAELSQAIPPAYTEWIGKQLIRHVALPEGGAA